MAKEPAPKPRVPDKADDRDQSERFIETARGHDADETGEPFERLFKKVIPAKEKKSDQQGKD